MIPKLHYISEGNSPKEHVENIQKACSAGAELVQLCLNEVSEKKHLKIAQEVRALTSYFQTRLLITNNYKIAKEVKADGVQLTAPNGDVIAARKYLYTWQIIGGTANTLEDCNTLIKNEVDYIRLSPFRASENKESSTITLGLNGYVTIFEALNTNTPIIGIGNITTKDVPAILETGVAGVAVSTEITENFDIIKTFNTLLSASSTKEQRHTF